VWYTLIDKRLFGDAIYEDLASRTRLQTSFVDYVKSGKAPLACALPAPIDFTLSMMLTILEIDISHFESFFKNWRTTVDVEPLIGEKPQMYKTLPFLLAGEPEETVLDNAVSQRSLYFKVYRRMIFKAEDLLECLVSKPLQDALISKHPAACSPVQQVSAGLEQRAAHLLKYSKRMDQSEEALLGLQRNEAYMKQSTNINALTVVACMFLPVTLSSAMLGMEFTFAALEKRRIADMACLAAIIMICSSFLWAISRGWTRIKRELMVESLIPAHGKDLYWVISFVGLLSIGVGCICILDGGTRAGMPLVVGGLSILLIAPLLVNLILPMRSWEWGLFLRAFGAKRKKHDRQPGETATVEETA
jgi:Mg2+ and Co2+ transporter CorA